MFGGSKKFNLKALDLKLEDRIMMEVITISYLGQVLSPTMTCQKWIVHGYIAHTKGHLINWAKAAEST